MNDMGYKQLEAQLLPIAREWYGVIPIWYAKKKGIDTSRLRSWARAKPEEVKRVRRGLYRWLPKDDSSIDYEYTGEAELLAMGGEGAFLWGQSALDFYDIGDVDGSSIAFVGTRTRIRPVRGIIWKVSNEKYETVGGIRVQSPKSAVYASVATSEGKTGSILSDAIEKNVISISEADRIWKKYGRTI